MYPATLEALDLFLRSAAIGQIVLIGGVHLRLPLRGRKLSLLSVAICMIAYLLLTAPIDDAEYGVWRNLLLIFTDALAYAIWFAVQFVFDGRFAAIKWPRPARFAAAALVAWHIYFFGFLEGNGAYHDINHAVAIILLVHVLYVALQGLHDDLVDARRRTRIVIAALISIYGITLALTQLLGDGVRSSWPFSLANAALCLLAVFLLGRYLLIGPTTDSVYAIAPRSEPTSSRRDVPVAPELKALEEKLEAFMNGRGYRQSSLTITTLAAQLSCPEHRLRSLINRVLGFRNFSTFLNARRVEDAREQLADPKQCSKPVLTIALDLGYGSIGPFNRAFKAQTGQTPTENRDYVKNRP